MPNKQIHITIGTAIALLMVLFSVSCKESANSEIGSNNTRLDSLFYAIRDTRYESSQQVIEDLMTQVEAHRQGAEPNDDLTMMCLRLS